MTSVYYFCTVCTYITYYKIIVINANMYYIHYRKHCFDVQIRYHLSKSKISKQILTVGLFQTLIVSSTIYKYIQSRLYIQNLIVRPHIMLAAGSILCFLNIRIPLGSFLLQITNFLSISVFRVIGLRTMTKAFGMILKFFFNCFINHFSYQKLIRVFLNCLAFILHSY